jgi:hypothetical protein
LAKLPNFAQENKKPLQATEKIEHTDQSFQRHQRFETRSQPVHRLGNVYKIGNHSSYQEGNQGYARPTHFCYFPFPSRVGASYFFLSAPPWTPPAIKQGRINEVNFSDLNIDLNQLFKICTPSQLCLCRFSPPKIDKGRVFSLGVDLPNEKFEREVTDYKVETVTDAENVRKVGIYTQHGTKKVKTAVGSHIEEDHGRLDLADQDLVFALFEACIEHKASTGDAGKASGVIDIFLQWKHFWTRAEGLAAGIKGTVEQKQRDNATAAEAGKSQDEIDFQSFVEKGILPKWFLLEEAVYPETVSNSLKRLPGSLHEKVIRNDSLLASKDLNGSMSLLLRSITFDAAAATKHWSASADPYLKIWGSNKDLHTGKPTKTAIIKDTLTPSWKELNLTFASRATLEYGSEHENVIIEVWNDNKFKDSFMSSAIIDCSHLAALGLRRLRSLGDADATKVDLVVRVDFSFGSIVKSLIPPTRYSAVRSLENRNAPEKREAILDVQLSFDKALVSAACAVMPQSV